MSLFSDPPRSKTIKQAKHLKHLDSYPTATLRFNLTNHSSSHHDLLPPTGSISLSTMSNPYHRRPLPDYFISSPLVALVYPLHQLLLHLRGPPRLPPPHAKPVRVVCISDSHTLEWPDVPDGDLLIHAGDLANDGSVREIQAAVDWLRSLPHPQKVVICGNHDSYFDVRSRCEEDRDEQSSASSFAAVSASTASIHSLEEITAPSRIDWGDIHYLQHSAVTLSFPGATDSPSTTSSTSSTTPLTTSRPRELTIYGAPQIPALMALGPEHAFTYPPHHDAWSRTIPLETDILITHTPHKPTSTCPPSTQQAVPTY
ncbi:uncharacterized protein N7473_008741 [Penicillium subrubescens]|uniref:uncharacterized protein n=1 Tax=Penicillium subrubescens TaxID=1316194 RepID=UPI002545A436|nr:uncharacterized protein N7473_008741 [Penicillium subrubescens]KAJ5886067.1 hypothetical protein N7473_008741 [Penicillium subrubescens]